MKPSVLILVQNLSVPFDRRVWNEATSLGFSGYQVFIICPRTEMNPSRKEVIDGIRIIRYNPILEGKSAPGLILEYIISITQFSLISFLLGIRNKINIVHICNPPDLLFIPALLMKILRRSKIIFDQHDLCPEVVLSKGSNPSSIYYKVSLILERLTYKVCTAVISTNLSYKEVAISRGGVKPNNVMVVRSGPKLEFGLKSNKFIRKPEDCRNLIYLGTMGLQEGVTVLIDMVELFTKNYDKKYNNIVLHLVGKGPEYEKVSALIIAKGLQKNIYLHGRVPDKELQELLRNCDIALNSDIPSVLNDLSTMNKVIEYMAFGLPMVQFKAKEGHFTAGEASLYLSEYSSYSYMVAVQELIEDFELRQHMSVYGLFRFQTELSWESQVPNLINIYKQVLD